MITRLTMAVVVVLVVLAGLPAVSQINRNPAPSTNAFKDATFLEMYLTPSIATNLLQYTFSLGNNPRFIDSGVTYSMTSIEAFYVVSTSATDFTATGGNAGTWVWDAKGSNQKSVAGWQAGTNSSNHLHKNENKTAAYTTLNVTGVPVTSGLHIYFSGGSKTDGYYRGTLSASPPLEVPEPAPFVALGGVLLASVTMLRRRSCSR